MRRSERVLWDVSYSTASNSTKPCAKETETRNRDGISALTRNGNTRVRLSKLRTGRLVSSKLATTYQ